MADPFDASPVMLFVAEPSGALLRRNPAFVTKAGEEARELAAIIHEDDRAGLVAWLEGLDPDGASASLHARLRGEHQKVEVHGRRADGEVHGAMIELPPEDPMVAIEQAILAALGERLDIVLWAIDANGRFLLHAGKACRKAGAEPGSFVGLNVFDLYPGSLAGPIRAALNGETSEALSEAHGTHWQTWYVPITAEGAVMHVAALSLDVTEATRKEEELREKLALIDRQQQAIRALTNPMIEVWDQVLTVPLIGQIDSAKAEQMLDRLLTEVSRVGAHFAIIDVTGVEVFDTSTANHILKLMSALKLLGAEGLITGIRPNIAQTMVALGLDLSSIRTCSNLREGLRYCISKLEA